MAGNEIEQVQPSRILILDDSTSNIRILQRMLSIAGYTNTKGITDPRDILAVYDEYKPDLLLLDLSMPHLDGFQVLELLRSHIQQDMYFPILIITAHTDQESRNRALRMGARDYISKPFDHAEMLMRVRNVLETRDLYKQLCHNNELLERKVAERTALWKETQMELVQRLGHVIEFRDEDTGFHITRMSQYSAALGREIGLDTETVELLLHASTLHDIGKIAIPDHILLKPGRLTPEEYEKMKKHASLGADMLKNSKSKLIQMAQVIALTHHEKWDGTGYPDGLREGQIPLLGRVVAICDVFDALTSPRPYKHAWRNAEALAYIQAESGRHFDPEIVAAFTRIFPEIEVIQRRYQSCAEEIE